MTGGQMAPTTMLGQETTTTPLGRSPIGDGYPLKVSEMLATLEGCSFVARVAVNNPANVRKARKAILKAFQMQSKNMGFSFVEVLSACPTNWKMGPQDALKRINDELIPYFPLKVFREKPMPETL